MEVNRGQPALKNQKLSRNGPADRTEAICDQLAQKMQKLNRTGQAQIYTRPDKKEPAVRKLRLEVWELSAPTLLSPVV